MVELNGPASFHVCLVGCIAVYCSLSLGGRGQSVAGIGCVARASSALPGCTGSLRGRVLKSGIMSSRLDKQARAVLHGCAERGLWAFDAVLRPLLPLSTTLREDGRITPSRPMAIALVSATGNRLNRCAHGGCDSDCIRVISSTTFDPITGRQESVKSLDEIRVTSEELRDAVDHSRCVDSTSVNVCLPCAMRARTYA